jgi:hypothetical protein
LDLAVFDKTSGFKNGNWVRGLREFFFGFAQSRPFGRSCGLFVKKLQTD